MLKHKLYTFLHNKTVVKAIYCLIVLNVISLILESYKEIRDAYGSLLDLIEYCSVIIFTIEYIVRIWTADLDPKYTQGTSWSKRIRFVSSTYGIIDLIAILPFYLPFFFAFDMLVIRILRLFRLLRIFKIGRYSKSLKMIHTILKETKAELTLTVFVTFILLIVSSTLMYYIESDDQPEKFANIGQAFWWSVATLTTVGYGDVYPITPLGKFLSAIIALIGIGFVALPTGIISSAFIEKIGEQRKQKESSKKKCTCPHCGTSIEIEE